MRFSALPGLRPRRAWYWIGFYFRLQGGSGTGIATTPLIILPSSAFSRRR